MSNTNPLVSCYKFNSDSDAPQPVLHYAAVLMNKINRGETLDRADKNRLSYGVNHNSFFKTAIPVMGWAFDFSEVLKRFVVKQYGDWYEVWAVDKMAVRAMTYGRIEAIVEA